MAEPSRSQLMFLKIITDPPAFRAWQAANIAWHEWRISDGRNAFGLKPKMVIPVAALTAFLVVFHWPANGDFSKMGQKFDPAGHAKLLQTVSEGTTFFCGQTKQDLKPCDSRKMLSGEVPTPPIVMDVPSALREQGYNVPGDQEPRGPVQQSLMAMMPTAILIFLVARFFVRRSRRKGERKERAARRLETPVPAPAPTSTRKLETFQVKDEADQFATFDRRIQQRLDELARQPEQTKPAMPGRASAFGRKLA